MTGPTTLEEFARKLLEALPRLRDTDAQTSCAQRTARYAGHPGMLIENCVTSFWGGGLRAACWSRRLHRRVRQRIRYPLLDLLALLSSR
ncbi:hypothetical protein D3C72_2164580 [compost metagenome]